MKKWQTIFLSALLVLLTIVSIVNMIAISDLKNENLSIRQLISVESETVGTLIDVVNAQRELINANSNAIYAINDQAGEVIKLYEALKAYVDAQLELLRYNQE